MLKPNMRPCGSLKWIHFEVKVSPEAPGAPECPRSSPGALQSVPGAPQRVPGALQRATRAQYVCCVQSVYGMCKGCSVLCVYSACSVHCVSAVCAPCTLCMCIVYSVYRLQTVCACSMHCMYIVYSLYCMSRVYVPCDSVVVQEYLISNSALTVRTVCTVGAERVQCVCCVYNCGTTCTMRTK